MKLKILKPRLQVASTSRLKVVSGDSWRSDKQTSAQRGYGYQWQKARAEYLKANPFCVFCLRDAGITVTEPAEVIVACTAKGIVIPYASVVDHSVAHRGDKTIFWDRSNWQSLCVPCHSSEAQKRDRAA